MGRQTDSPFSDKAGGGLGVERVGDAGIDQQEDGRPQHHGEQGLQMDRIFDGKRTAKLGTEKNPAKVSVKTKKKQKELAAQFEANGWHCQIEVAKDKPEDLTDLDILMNPVKTVVAEQKTGRNDPCPCGSGKKYKKCCGQ